MNQKRNVFNRWTKKFQYKSFSLAPLSFFDFPLFLFLCFHLYVWMFEFVLSCVFLCAYQRNTLYHCFKREFIIMNSIAITGIRVWLQGISLTQLQPSFHLFSNQLFLLLFYVKTWYELIIRYCKTLLIRKLKKKTVCIYIYKCINCAIKHFLIKLLFLIGKEFYKINFLKWSLILILFLKICVPTTIKIQCFFIINVLVLF